MLTPEVSAILADMGQDALVVAVGVLAAAVSLKAVAVLRQAIGNHNDVDYQRELRKGN